MTNLHPRKLISIAASIVVLLIISTLIITYHNSKRDDCQAALDWLKSIDFDSLEYPNSKSIPIMTKLWNFITRGQTQPLLAHPRPNIGEWIIKGQRIVNLDKNLRFFAQSPKSNCNLCEITFALGYIGGVQNTECLTNLLKSNDFRVRRHAASALGKIKSKQCSILLKETALRDLDPNVRANAMDALFEIDEEIAKETASFIAQNDTNLFLVGIAKIKLSQYQDKRK